MLEFRHANGHMHININVLTNCTFIYHWHAETIPMSILNVLYYGSSVKVYYGSNIRCILNVVTFTYLLISQVVNSL